MRVEVLAIPEVLLITRERHEDERGWFTELYNHAEHRQAGLGATFVQDNVSRSLPGVVSRAAFSGGSLTREVGHLLRGSNL